MTDLRAIAANILGISSGDADQLIELRHGARTRMLFATPPGLRHNFSGQATRVVVKLYKGDWSTAGGKEYLAYHADHFHRVPALHQSPSFQKSLTAGIHRVSGGFFPYALLEYIAGDELADIIKEGGMNPGRAAAIMKQILFNIWIPLWDGGLRFKDCHPGNFIIGSDDRTYMIDTEQMRKDAAELLATPNEWRKRQAHEELGISRLPGLLSRIKTATGGATSENAVRNAIKSAIKSTDLNTHLSALGRGVSRADAEQAARELLELI